MSAKPLKSQSSNDLNTLLSVAFALNGITMLQLLSNWVENIPKNQPPLLISKFLLRSLSVQRIRATDVNSPQPPEQKQKLAC